MLVTDTPLLVNIKGQTRLLEGPFNSPVTLWTNPFRCEWYLDSRQVAFRVHQRLGMCVHLVIWRIRWTLPWPPDCLYNIVSGCGYPPDIVCDVFAEKYHNYSRAGQTFPCHYSTYNPWMVIAYYNRSWTHNMVPIWIEAQMACSCERRYYRKGSSLVSNKKFEYIREETVSAIMTSIFIPNIIFVVSVGVLVYW